MAKKEPNPVGRPRKLVCDDETLEQLRMIAAGQHTQLEAAAILKVSIRTFEEFLRANEKAREVWEEGRGNGQGSLRRMQFVAAQKGNVTMQIWLGKQYLGQKDRHENTLEAGDSFKEVWTMLGKSGAGQ